MFFRFSVPPLIDSPLARLDPRWRLACLVLTLGLTASVRRWPSALACLGLALLLAALASMDWRWFVHRLAVVAGLLALFIVPLPFLSRDAWGFAGVMTLKVLALFTLSTTLLVTGRLETTFRAAQALWVPGLLVHLLLLTYRYIFLLADELARLRVALRVRAFRNRPNLHSYRTVAAASGTLLVRSYERAERVESAMRCRGFDGTFRTLSSFSTHSADVLALLAVVLVLAGILALELWLPG
ncbi:MAG: energy-coupling factor transporter transmembrane component T [Gemmataceae bacterium]